MAADDAAASVKPLVSVEPLPRFVLDPAGLDEAFEHAGDRRGTNLEAFGNVYGQDPASASARLWMALR
jgi:hypothetical protein